MPTATPATSILPPPCSMQDLTPAASVCPPLPPGGHGCQPQPPLPRSSRAERGLGTIDGTLWRHIMQPAAHLEDLVCARVGGGRREIGAGAASGRLLCHRHSVACNSYGEPGACACLCECKGEVWVGRGGGGGWGGDTEQPANHLEDLTSSLVRRARAWVCDGVR